MANLFWACWDGGGNLTPSLGIARELEARGHHVQFFGRPEMVGRVEAAGLRATALDHAYTDLDRYAFHPLPTVFGYTSSATVGEELIGRVAAEAPDAVVVDAMFSAALQVAPEFERPTGIMLHTFLHHMTGGWQANFAMQSESRQRAGFDPLDDLDQLWGTRDLLHVNALRALDGPATFTWPNIIHGAPVLASESRAVPYELPWNTDDQTPLVLLSFSTVPEQRSVDSLQRALDALGELEVHVVATTGDIVDPSELRVPPNGHVTKFADHDALLQRAAMVVGHGGHGTTMRALTHGCPLVVMPAKGADQAPIANLVREWGAGLALPTDADTASIRAAAAGVLADPSYQEVAGKLAQEFVGMDGAILAADAVEDVLLGRSHITR